MANTITAIPYEKFVDKAASILGDAITKTNDRSCHTCPKCGGRLYTAYTRPLPDGRIKRLKRCRCGYERATFER